MSQISMLDFNFFFSITILNILLQHIGLTQTTRCGEVTNLVQRGHCLEGYTFLAFLFSTLVT